MSWITSSGSPLNKKSLFPKSKFPDKKGSSSLPMTTLGISLETYFNITIVGSDENGKALKEHPIIINKSAYARSSQL
jgi:hypothetical protein